MSGEEETKSIEYEIVPECLRNSVMRTLNLINVVSLLLMKLIEEIFLKYLAS